MSNQQRKPRSKSVDDKYDRMFYYSVFNLMKAENELRYHATADHKGTFRISEMIALIDRLTQEGEMFGTVDKRIAFLKSVARGIQLAELMHKENLDTSKSLVQKQDGVLIDNDMVGLVQTASFDDFIRAEGTGPNDKGRDMLVVSPLHPKYRDRSVFMDYVDNVFVNKSDALKTVEAFRKGDFVETPCYETMSSEKPFSAIYNNADRYNLARLANYTDPANYKVLLDHVMRVPESEFMDKEKMNLAYDLLEELSKRGEIFKIEPDDRAGQLKVTLENKMNIRLTDTKADQAFVGRIYQNGLMAYYTHIKKVYETNAQGKRTFKTPAYEPKTAGEILLMLDHLRGKDRSLGRLKRTVDAKGKQSYTAYHASKDYSCRVNDDCMIRVKNERFNEGYMDSDMATELLDTALVTAKRNFKEALDLEYLKDEAYFLDQMEEGYEPNFSSDDLLYGVQTEIWQRLTGEGNVLENVIRIDEIADEVIKQQFHGEYAEDITHLNPVLVGAYMDGTSAYANNKQVLRAMRTLGYTKENVIANDFYNESIKEKLIRFDETTAINLLESNDPFKQKIASNLKEVINSTGAVLRSASIDENGVVSYEAVLATGKTPTETDKKMVLVKGQIGQFFDKDERGLYQTRFNRDNNYYFVPGYEATVVKGEGSLESRTKLRGYEQVLFDNLSMQIKNDLIALPSTITREDGVGEVHVGEPTSINNTYRALYDTRYALDHFENGLARGAFDETYIKALVGSASLRVRYNNYFRDGSTMISHYIHTKSGDYNDFVNDNFTSALDLTGYRNMSVLSAEGDGYFDPIATSTARNQGIVRYLDPNAKVTKDGFIVKADKVTHIPMITEVINKGDKEYFMNMPFDRQIMTLSNLMKAERLVKDVGFAQMPLKGWTLEDGFVVSKKFAQENGLAERDLIPGDKLSDLFGNKGVINLVVDTDMSDEEAEKVKLKDIVDLFKANPDLGIVMSSLAPLSRFNAGLAKETIDEQTATDLIVPNKGVFKGSIGRGRFIVTPMYVDEKSKVYDLDDVKSGKGRKVSAQLAWALNSLGAEAVLNESYARNKSVDDFKEYLLTLGCDISDYGKLSDKILGNTLNDKEVRGHYDVPELIYREGERVNKKDGSITKVQMLNKKAMSLAYGELLSNERGFIKLPFDIKLANGNTLNKTEDGKFLLPMLNARLRQGQDFDDGTTSVHNYTRHYLKILESASKYMDAEKRLSEDNLSPDDKKKQENVLADMKRVAQSEFNTMTGDIVKRQFEGKINIIKNGIMSQRVPRSGTLVWTGDPRLKLNEVAIGEDRAKQLGVKDNHDMMIWRDPILNDMGVKDLFVRVDKNLNGGGMAVNPVIAKAFEGDFDGDSIGAKAHSSKEARQEAKLKYSMEATLLNKNVQPDANGDYPLSIHTDMDFKFVTTKDSDFAERLDSITKKINEVDREYKVKNKGLAQKDNFKELNELIHEGFEKSYGEGIVSYASVEDHVKSLEAIIKTGAKGSLSKFQDYFDYYGITGEIDTTKGVDYSTLKLEDKPNITPDRIRDVQYAVSVKTDGTGIAGAVSQRAVKVLRNKDIKTALGLTYPVTQSVVQSKHNAIQARKRLDALMSGVSVVWSGNTVEKVTKGDTVTWERSNEEAVDKNTWKENVYAFYTDPDGLNVNVNKRLVDRLADAMVNERTGTIENIHNLGKEAVIMDRLAYGGNLDVLLEGCRNGENLFDGKWNKYFAPKQMKERWGELRSRQGAKVTKTVQQVKDKAFEIVGDFADDFAIDTEFEY